MILQSAITLKTNLTMWTGRTFLEEFVVSDGITPTDLRDLTAVSQFRESNDSKIVYDFDVNLSSEGLLQLTMSDKKTALIPPNVTSTM
jgi:hypothetical protein